MAAVAFLQREGLNERSDNDEMNKNLLNMISIFRKSPFAHTKKKRTQHDAMWCRCSCKLKLSHIR